MENKKIPPNPSRFLEFEELSDGTGFRIPDGKVFKFEDNGGWFDEYGNFYNSNGDPDDPNAEYDDEEGEGDDYYNEYDNYEDDLLNEYDYGESRDQGGNDDLYREYDHKIKINEMEHTIDSYGKQDIVVEFNNLNFKANRKVIADYLNSNANSRLNMQEIIIDTYPNSQKKTGKGRIITNDKNTAKQIIKNHGNNVLDRPIYFYIEKIDKFSDDEGDPLINMKKLSINDKKSDVDGWRNNKKKTEENIDNQQVEETKKN